MVQVRFLEKAVQNHWTGMQQHAYFFQLRPTLRQNRRWRWLDVTKARHPGWQMQQPKKKKQVWGRWSPHHEWLFLVSWRCRGCSRARPGQNFKPLVETKWQQLISTHMHEAPTSAAAVQMNLLPVLCCCAAAVVGHAVQLHQASSARASAGPCWPSRGLDVHLPCRPHGEQWQKQENEHESTEKNGKNATSTDENAEPPAGIFFFSIGFPVGAIFDSLFMILTTLTCTSSTSSASSSSGPLFVGGVTAFDEAPLGPVCIGTAKKNAAHAHSHIQQHVVDTLFAVILLCIEASWNAKWAKHKSNKHSCKICPTHAECPTITPCKEGITMVQPQVAVVESQDEGVTLSHAHPENKSAKWKNACQTLQCNFSRFQFFIYLWAPGPKNQCRATGTGMKVQLRGLSCVIQLQIAVNSTWSCMKQHVSSMTCHVHGRW